MIDTVIFDMDGTVTDTQAIYSRAWKEVGIPGHIYRMMIGRSAVSIRKLLLENGYDPDEISRKKEALVQKELEKGVPLKPGARETLTWLREHGFATVLATSSAKSRADGFMKETGLYDLLDFIVSGNELEHGKPEPDCFLMAAQAAGKTPEQCIVVEDSYNGVRAGHAARMVTVMIPDLIPPDEEMREKADVILPSLFALPDYITGITAKKGTS